MQRKQLITLNVVSNVDIMVVIRIVFLECTDGYKTGDIRLLFNAGIQVFLSGHWLRVTNSSMSWTKANSEVVCRQLGYNGQFIICYFIILFYMRVFLYVLIMRMKVLKQVPMYFKFSIKHDANKT